MPQVVNEMASAAGLSCLVDPVLVTALKVQRTGMNNMQPFSRFLSYLILYFS